MPGHAKLIVGVLLACVCAAQAGETVSIRLVEASNAPGAIDPALKDVEGAITGGQLKFKSLRLIKSATARFPVTFSNEMQPGFVVTCKGAQEALEVQVTRKDKVLLKSTVQLADDKPVILGGFRGGGGKLLIVLLTR